MKKSKKFKKMAALVLSFAFVCNITSSTSASKTGSSPHAQILYNSTYTGTEQQLRTAFSNATAGFKSTFGITFTLDYVSSSSALSRPRSCTGVCSTSCCGSSNCDTAHGNSGRRLLKKMSSTYTFRIGVVGHALCGGDGKNHIGISGVAEFPDESRRAVITTNTVYSLKYLMQHELSHNLGVWTHCSGKSECVMNEDLEYTDKWCTAHSNMIKNNK